MTTESKDPTNPSTWHECPTCGESWDGGPIPKLQQADYGTDRWSKLIAIYDRGKDRTTAYRCPSCGTTYDRDTGALIAKGAGL